MDAKHTATPWCIGEVNFEENTDTHIGIRDEAGDWVVCEVQCDVPELPGHANAEFIVRACNDYARLTKVEANYNWLMDCARKTGVFITFNGETMSVVHGAKTELHDALVEALGDAIKTIKAMSCKDLSCDEPEDVSDMESILAKAGAA